MVIVLTLVADNFFLESGHNVFKVKADAEVIIVVVIVVAAAVVLIVVKATRVS